MSRGHEARFILYDEAAGMIADNLPATGRDHIDPARPSITSRRASLIRQLSYRYGVTVYPHPRRVDTIVVSESDYSMLLLAVATDPLLNAVGRGYYSWLGGELAVIKAPDWTCDPMLVALTRTRAALLDGPLRPYMQRLVNRLDRAAHGLTRLIRGRGGKGPERLPEATTDDLRR